MRANWEMATLAELTINHDGRRKPIKESDRYPGPYPYYGASGIVDHVAEYLFDGTYLLISEDGENLRTRQTPIAFMANGKFWVNNHAHILTGNDKADTRFLMYAIEGMDINGYLTGAVMPKLTQSNLNKITLSYPSIDEQRHIVKILGSLDDKIELNRKTNETLEAIARTLFQAWFVDFEPVRAKMEGRWKRGQSLPCLPAHLYDLFPDRLVGSDERESPDGWIFGQLSSICNLNPESWTKRNRPQSIHYIDLSSAKLGRIEQISEYKIDNAPSRAQRILLKNDTILGTVRPENCSYALVHDNGLTGSTGFAVLRPKKPIYTEIVYLSATSQSNIDRLSALADGAAYPAVRPEVVLETIIPQIPDELIIEFSKTTNPLLTSIAENEKMSRTLSQLRDTLLPRLMSGELRIPDAERIAGEAL